MNSLRARLLIASSLILTGFCAFTVVALDQAFRSSAFDAQLEKMKGLIYSLVGAIDVAKKGELQFQELSVQNQRLLTKGSGLAALIFEKDGKEIWRSPSWKNDPPQSRQTVESGQWLFSTPDPSLNRKNFQLDFGVTWLTDEEGSSRNFTVYLEEDDTGFVRQIRIYRQTLLRWLLLSVLFLLIALIFLLHWGLLPLKRVAKEIGLIQAGHQENIQGSFPSELHPLTKGLNNLLRHEHGQLKRYRNALNDLAHSLKTPLAALRGMATSRMSEQIEQIDKVLDYQVRRALTAGRTVFTHPLSPRKIVDKLTRALTKVYRERNIRFETQIDPTIEIAMEEGDLMEVFGNLLDNACKWGRSKVVIHGEKTEHSFTIAIEDDGPGFPKGDREHLLERGVRADRRVPGEGIGLAVVADIILLYDGIISLGDSSFGGAKVSLSIPC